ncbi:hypothetical protein D0863_12073 [Hortaea werneckii]|uniref:Uncharacterized protein n=1 Tax=Hortaea werneckii TaxID=91943 RepID=A0A3M7D4C3_HORWE|nr:hypothetical protein D0863_12073 [Hortaea werneckii]
MAPPSSRDFRPIWKRWYSRLGSRHSSGPGYPGRCFRLCTYTGEPLVAQYASKDKPTIEDLRRCRDSGDPTLREPHKLRARWNGLLLETWDTRRSTLSSLCSSIRFKISDHGRMHAIFSSGLMRPSPVLEPGKAVKYSATSGPLDGILLGLDVLIVRSGLWTGH